MSISPEDQSFISALRFRMAPGSTEPPTLDEMKRAILILRESRHKVTSLATSGPKKSKSAPTAAAVADALSDLDSM